MLAVQDVCSVVNSQALLLSVLIFVHFLFYCAHFILCIMYFNDSSSCKKYISTVEVRYVLLSRRLVTGRLCYTGAGVFYKPVCAIYLISRKSHITQVFLYMCCTNYIMASVYMVVLSF